MLCEIWCILFAHFQLCVLKASLRLIAIEDVRNYGKIVYIKNIFENSWWEDTYPSSYPPESTQAISYRNHEKSLAYFSYLAPLILFFFTKRQSQRGACHNYPHWIRSWVQPIRYTELYIHSTGNTITVQSVSIVQCHKVLCVLTYWINTVVDCLCINIRVLQCLQNADKVD